MRFFSKILFVNELWAGKNSFSTHVCYTLDSLMWTELYMQKRSFFIIFPNGKYWIIEYLNFETATKTCLCYHFMNFLWNIPLKTTNIQSWRPNIELAWALFRNLRYFLSFRKAYMVYLMCQRRSHQVIKIMSHDVKQFKSLGRIFGNRTAICSIFRWILS